MEGGRKRPAAEQEESIILKRARTLTAEETSDLQALRQLCTAEDRSTAEEEEIILEMAVQYGIVGQQSIAQLCATLDQVLRQVSLLEALPPEIQVRILEYAGGYGATLSRTLEEVRRVHGLVSEKIVIEPDKSCPLTQINPALCSPGLEAVAIPRLARDNPDKIVYPCPCLVIYYPMLLLCNDEVDNIPIDSSVEYFEVRYTNPRKYFTAEELYKMMDRFWNRPFSNAQIAHWQRRPKRIIYNSHGQPVCKTVTAEELMAAAQSMSRAEFASHFANASLGFPEDYYSLILAVNFRPGQGETMVVLLPYALQYVSKTLEGLINAVDQNADRLSTEVSRQ